jgi:hypothetical protein
MFIVMHVCVIFYVMNVMYYKFTVLIISSTCFIVHDICFLNAFCTLDTYLLHDGVICHASKNYYFLYNCCGQPSLKCTKVTYFNNTDHCRVYIECAFSYHWLPILHLVAHYWTFCFFFSGILTLCWFRPHDVSSSILLLLHNLWHLWLNEC